MRPRILITDRIHQTAIERGKEFADIDMELDLTHEELIERIRGYDALIVRSGTKVTKDVIENADRLKIIGRAGVGLDNIDLKAAEEKGIKVVNSPEASTISVAELFFGSLIAFMRKIIEADISMRKGRWDRNRFQGSELYGKTLGIIGFGRIGREVALRARAFGMNIVVFDPHITEEDTKEYNCKSMELDELLRNSDIITLHIPLTDKTRNMIDRDRLRLMKNCAVIVNMARGGIVNEKDLYDALKDGQIKGAILDVYEKEPQINSQFISLKNVVLTPHIGALTEEAQVSAGMVVIEKIRNFFMR